MTDTPLTPVPPAAIPVAQATGTASPPVSLSMTQEQILEVCKQIDDAKNGRGQMPDVKVMRAALDQIRVNWRAGVVSPKGRGKAPAAPVDLASLFT